MPSPAIRTATADEIDAVLELWREADAHDTVGAHRAGLQRLLATDPQALLVVESEGVVVGSLIASWDGWRGSMYRLAVHPSRRRRGLATALVREGERRLHARGAERLAAIVASEDPGAGDFWIAAGYERQAGRERFVRRLEQ